MQRCLFYVSYLLFFYGSLFSQGENNQKIFQDFMHRRGDVYRTASGFPGPKYFQNRADYKLKAALDAAKNTIKGSVEIIYTNNSPDPLPYVWLYINQNRLTKTSRGTLTTPVGGNRYNGDVNKGMHIANLLAQTGDGKNVKTFKKYLINDTRMQVFFDDPIVANGGKAKMNIDFEFDVPTDGMDRMGKLQTEKGDIYAIAQWYPQMAVYDDVKGWNTEPYLGAGEFYYDYGNYSVEITVPYNFVVVASGDFLNPKEVLSATMYDRYMQAKKSDSTVMILNENEIGDASLYAKSSGMLTWKFKMDNARDVAFATSNAFIWDGAKIDLPGGKTAFASSVYPKESNQDKGWKRSTQFTKSSIEDYSNKWYVYPYSSAVNVAANIHGMEYPGVSFCHYQSVENDLWGVTNHEFGHNWFPMIVGSNERLYPWMDEGFNTFINSYNNHHGEFPDELLESGHFLAGNKSVINTYPDIISTKELGVSAYYKPAIGLILLREYILGHERFDYAFRSYIRTWAFKHPQPSDFFNHMDNASGENLNWFWKGWFYGDADVDISLDHVTRIYDGGYQISLSNKGDLPLPVSVEIMFDDSTTDTVNLPVEIWQRGNTWNFHYNTTKKATAFRLYPENIAKMIPNKSNDTFFTIENKE